MTHLTALQEANYTYTHRDTLTLQNRVDAAVALGQWGLFSGRQIAKFTGLIPATVSKLIEKRDSTGARLDPEYLPVIIELVQDRTDAGDRAITVRRALKGTSTYFLAKLVGVSESTIRRWAA